MTPEFREKIINLLLVSSFFCFTLFLFGPAHMYFSNLQEYSSSAFEIFPGFIVLAVFCALLLTTVLAFLGSTPYKKAVSVLLVVSFLLWLQGNVFVWDYGPLDGREIDWNAKAVYGLIDGGIWIVLVVFAYLMAGRCHKIARRASIAFLIIQTVSLLIAIHRAPDVSDIRKEIVLDEESVFNFSTEKNVLILVLDSFQGDVFQEIVEESPRYRDVFDGFTYYRNALGGYPYTGASVPLILTGHFYENEAPFFKFLKEVYSENSVPRLLMEDGFKVDLVGAQKKIYADKEIATSNVALDRLVGENTKIKEATFLFDVALFRCIPHFAKRYVYNNQAWLFSRLYTEKAGGDFPAGFHRPSIEFMKRMIRKAVAEGENKTFKYFHLTIPHAPIRINQELEYVELPASRENYKEQAKGSLNIAERLFKKMKSIGVYDNSMILLVADHGAIFDIDMQQGEQASKGENRFAMMNRIKTKAFPLILIKPFGSKGELKISDAPVSLADIAKTIISELNLEAEVPGASILKIGESENRNRRFLFHELDLYATRQLYFAPMREFTVSGLSWLDDSWRPTYRLFTSEGVKDSSPKTYQYDSLIRFGKEGNSLEYQGWGWSHPEKGFTWTDGSQVALIVPIGEAESNIELEAVFEPFIVPGKVEKQRVRIKLDYCSSRKDIGEWLVTENKLQPRTVIVPKDCMNSDIAKVIFELPDAVSPSELGTGDDRRTLGLRMHSIKLSEKHMEPERYNWGSPIRFGAGGNHIKYESNGWDCPDKACTWTKRRRASIAIPLARTGSDIMLETTFWPYIVPDRLDEQRVSVFINGKNIGNWIVTKMVNKKLVIPNGLLNGSEIEVAFELPDAVSPAELGYGNDGRVMGIAMRSMVLREMEALSAGYSGKVPAGSRYQLGSPIQFGENGNSLEYEGIGWTNPEASFTWTNGKSASLVIPIGKPESDIELKGTFIPFIVPGKLDRQRVNILINGKSVGSWVAKRGLWARIRRRTDLQERTILIPNDLLTDSEMVLTFELPDAISPAELNESSDRRILGIAMQSIVLSESLADRGM